MKEPDQKTELIQGIKDDLAELKELMEEEDVGERIRRMRKLPGGLARFRRCVLKCMKDRNKKLEEIERWEAEREEFGKTLKDANGVSCMVEPPEPDWEMEDFPEPEFDPPVMGWTPPELLSKNRPRSHWRATIEEWEADRKEHGNKILNGEKGANGVSLKIEPPDPSWDLSYFPESRKTGWTPPHLLCGSCPEYLAPLTVHPETIRTIAEEYTYVACFHDAGAGEYSTQIDPWVSKTPPADFLEGAEFHSQHLIYREWCDEAKKYLDAGNVPWALTNCMDFVEKDLAEPKAKKETTKKGN